MGVLNGLFLLALLIVDGRAVLEFLTSGRVATAAGLHLIACWGGFLQARWLMASRKEGAVFALWMLPLSLLFPILGLALAGGLALAVGLGRTQAGQGKGFLALSEVLGEDTATRPAFGVSVTTIPEIMWGSDVEARRRAVHTLRGLAPADSLPILRRLTQDSDEIVRLFSLAERRRIVAEFEEKVRVLEVKRENDHATVSDLVHLAEIRLAEVEAGLPVDARQRAAILDAGLGVLYEARLMEPGRMDVELTMLRCALAAGDQDLASRVLERMEQAGGSDELLSLPRCEVHFLNGSWEKLVNCLRSLPPAARRGQQMEKVLALWNIPGASGGRAG